MASAWSRALRRARDSSSRVVLNDSSWLLTCVSTWLKAGIEPKRVAEWAGHSLEVLLRTYTHRLDDGEREALRRIQKALTNTGGRAGPQKRRGSSR